MADFGDERSRIRLPREDSITDQRMVESMGSVSAESSGRRQHLFRGRRVTVRDLVNADLLEPGTVLVYDRKYSEVA